VLTCKKHTEAIAGHDHVMNVTAQLARNSRLKVRVNRKVDTTAANNNKQRDVQAMDFGIPGYEHLVWDVSLVSDRIGSSLQHGLNGKLQLGDYLNARATIKNRRYKRDYAAKNIAFAPAILSVAGKIHPEFLRLLWVLADMQTVKYFNLVGDEEDIGNERFKWSRASTFRYNRIAIGLAVAYASAIRTHLSVHGTAHPMSAASVRPRSAADCLICSAVDISHPRQQGSPPASSSAVSDSVRSDIIIGLGTGTVGGFGNPSLVSSMPSDVVHGPFDSASAPPSSSRGNYLATQSQASYHSAFSSPSARHPSGFDGVNEEANVRANAAVVPGHADVRASAVMTDDNNDDVDDGNFDDTLSEILGTSFRVATSPDLDLAFGAVDVNVDLACTSLLSPLSYLPPPTSSPPFSAAAGEPI